MTDLTLFNVRKHCTALSPVPSTVFYADGCNFRCEGCLYWEARPNQSVSVYSAEECAETALSAGTVCVVLSGGNPVLQARGFAEMMRIIRERKDMGLIMYVGETAEELEELASKDPDVEYLAHTADIVISGRYVPSLDTRNSMVGSSNQKVDFRTGRYAEYRHLYETPGRRIEIEIDVRGRDASMSYSGVPTPEQRRLFDALGRDLTSGTRRSRPVNIIVDAADDRTLVFELRGEEVARMTADGSITISLEPIPPENVDDVKDAIVSMILGGNRIGNGS